jgi:hypothetical protein
MTTTSQTSVISSGLRFHGRHAQSLYQVVINGEDGNYEEFEIEASSISEAEAKASDLALEYMVDLTYVEIYKIA